ncbi:SPOR domain-containing protein [Roseobacter sp. HKCCA0434]|uniref:SPOR domain-containing protein n=1 Tax=Roseobacter sp. HKCCA0434 TaxID=3079297 RepID=UPI0029057DD8|nr:SPOR domain-containing protein [Roseobacter sp. HKCCA0434]
MGGMSCWHVAAAVAVVALSGCEQMAASGPAATPAAAPASTPQQMSSAGLVPRPDVFAQRALGAWDGGPSLGGPWIAHPAATGAERVDVTDVDTGRSITAALFRRGSDQAGPPFQISADAAVALGIQPGVPVELDVVALRPGTVVEATAPASEPAADPDPAAEDVVEATPPQTPPVAIAQEPAAPPVAVAPQPVVPAPAATPPAAPIDRPFVQVGTFGVAQNAEALAAELERDGLTVRLVPSGNLTRVLVGPAASEAERDAVQARLREMGFADTLPVNP